MFSNLGMVLFLFLWNFQFCSGTKIDYFPESDYSAPEFAHLTPEEIKALKTKDEVFYALNNDPNILDTYLKMGNDKLIEALKGFSVLGSIHAAETEKLNISHTLSSNRTVGENGNNISKTKTTVTSTMAPTTVTTTKTNSTLTSRIGNATLQSFANVSKSHSVNGILETASEVLAILNNATDQSFYDVFFIEMNDNAISTVIHAVVIAAQLTKYSNLDENTKGKLETFIKGLELLSTIAYSNTDFYVEWFCYYNGFDVVKKLKEKGLECKEEFYYRCKPAYKVEMDELCFNSNIVRPVNSTTHLMMAYLKNGSSKYLDEFEEEVRNYRSFSLAAYSFANTADTMLYNIIAHWKHDMNKFIELRSKLTKYYFHVNILDAFDFAIYLMKQKNYSFKLDFGKDYWVLSDTEESLRAAFKKSTNLYNETFFPGFIRDTIIKPVLDKNGGSNCELAQTILTQINEKDRCKCGNYVVIVSDGVSKSDQYASVGFRDSSRNYYNQFRPLHFDNKWVVVEEYNGNTVLVFNATKNFAKKKNAFLAHNGILNVTSTAESHFDWNNLNNQLQIASLEPNKYQMAVFRDYYNPCHRTTNDSTSEVFDVRPRRWGVVPNSFKLWFAVVF